MRRIGVVASLVGIALVLPASALAGPATTEVEPPATVVEPATTVVEASTTTVDPSTTVVDPATTTTVDVPTTTNVTTPGTDGTPSALPSVPGTGACTVDCVPEDLPCVGQACITGFGSGVVPTSAIGAGVALPYTGVAETTAAILLAIVVALGGVVAWRWAQIQEAMAAAARARASTRNAVVTTSATGYEQSLRSAQVERRARMMFTPRLAS